MVSLPPASSVALPFCRLATLGPPASVCSDQVAPSIALLGTALRDCGVVVGSSVQRIVVHAMGVEDGLDDHAAQFQRALLEVHAAVIVELCTE